MTGLRIGIDVHSIGSQKGGNETYYRELLRELQHVPCEHHFFLYHSYPQIAELFQSGPRFSFCPLRPARSLFRIPLTLPRYARRDQLDIFHAQFIVPPFLKCRTVTTVPDIAFEHFPEMFPAPQRLALKLLVRESVKRADHVITVSHYSKNDIAQTYGVSPDKITVTYEGAGDEFRPMDRKQAQEILARKYAIEGQFILYLGRLQARKNLRRLVEAYAMVRKAGFPHKLVLAGKPDSLFQAVLERIRELKLQNDVILPGYVESKDSPAFYNAAEVFVFPSFFEGFGLPVVEAMACGTPVITSRGSSLEEIAAGSALIIDPLDELSIANALQQVLQDPELRLRLSRAGLVRSLDFSFKNAAQQTVKVYEQVAGNL
jgi:glycosyltransferase involved in cell wall biosynthesis